MPTVQKFDRLAVDVLLGIDQLLIDQNIVESIVKTYIKFCRSDESRRLDISEIPITEETHLRLRFECLCFSTFSASLQSSKYLKEKRWFVKLPNQRLIGLFDGAIAAALIEFCNNTGMSELHEIILVSIDQKPTLGLGDHLDPLNRLEDYRAAFVKARGSELERFAGNTRWSVAIATLPICPYGMAGSALPSVVGAAARRAVGQYRPSHERRGGRKHIASACRRSRHCPHAQNPQ